MNRRLSVLAGSSMLVIATTLAAQAQTTQQKSAAADIEEVVVTGTLIRGIAPVGSNVIGISRQDIESSGLIDTNALLAQMVPQSRSFMIIQQPGNGSTLGLPRIPVIRPNLRNLGDEFSGSGSPTL